MKRTEKALALVRCIAILTLLSFSQPLFAADLTEDVGSANGEPAASDWTVSFTPYGWLTYLSGSSTVKGRTVDVDVDPIQVIDHLDNLPWFSYLEARKGPFAFYNDVMYADLALSRTGFHTVNRGLTGSVGASLGMNFTQVIAEAGGLYQIARWELGGSLKDPLGAPGYTAIDVLAGARYWRQNLDLNFDLTGTLDRGGLVISGNRAIARSGTVDWVDPLVGVRLRHQFEPGQDLLLRGDIGGFGAGSQFSWNALGAYNYVIMTRSSYTISAYIGYRALQVNYTQGNGKTRYQYDMVQHGPVTGLTMKF